MDAMLPHSAEFAHRSHDVAAHSERTSSMTEIGLFDAMHTARALRRLKPT